MQPPHHLVLPSGLLDAVRAQLAWGRSTVELGLGTTHDPSIREWFAQPDPSQAEQLCRFVALPDFLRGASHLYWAGTSASDRRIVIEVGLIGEQHVSAAVRSTDAIEPLDRVSILGPAWQSTRPGPGSSARPGNTAPGDTRFSRTIGALHGIEPLARLQSLAVAQIGSSRLGSLLAASLAKLGVQRITLIDGDHLEDHHLEAMDLLYSAALRDTVPKVTALADSLAAIAPTVAIEPIAEPVEHPTALRALTRAGLIVSAPDRAEPRVLAALCASAYHRIHLDVGTGIFGDADSLEAGAEIRLTLPGEGCLLCAGGVAETPDVEDWRDQRAGSLRSLNQLATGYAMFLLERVAAGTRAGSVHVIVRLDREGRMEVEERLVERRADCPICAASGQGDGVWGQALV